MSSKKNNLFPINFQRGEVATALTIAAFFLVTASAIISNVFVGPNKQTTQTSAQTSNLCPQNITEGLACSGASGSEWCIQCTGETTTSCSTIGKPYHCENNKWHLTNPYGECNAACGSAAPTTPAGQPTTPAGQPTTPAQTGGGCGYSPSGKFLPNGYCSPLVENDTRYCQNGSWLKNDSICKVGDKFCMGNGYKPTSDFGCCSGKTDSGGTCSASGGGAPVPTTPSSTTCSGVNTCSQLYQAGTTLQYKDRVVGFKNGLDYNPDCTVRVTDRDVYCGKVIPTPTTEYYSHCCNGANRIGCMRGTYTGGCSGTVVTSTSSCGVNVCSQTPSNAPVPTSVPAVCIMSGAKGLGCASKLGGSNYCTKSFGANYYCNTVADCCVGTTIANTPTPTPVPVLCSNNGNKGIGCASRLGGNTYCSSNFGANYYCNTVADCCVGTTVANTPTPTIVPPTVVPPTPVPDAIVEIPADIVTWGATVLMDPTTNVLINNILGMMGAGSLNLNDPSTIDPFIDFILTTHIKPAISNYNAQHVNDGLAIDVINEDLLKKEVKNVIEVMNHQYKAYMADPSQDTFNMTITVRESPSVVQLNIVVKFVGAIQAGEYTHDISLDRAKFKLISPQLKTALNNNSNIGFVATTLNAMLTANNSKYTINQEMLKYNLEGVNSFLTHFQENPDTLNQFNLLITYLTYTNPDGSPKDSVRVNYKIRFEPQVNNGITMSYPQ